VITGIGTDIVSISRIRDIIESASGRSFEERVFTARELDQSLKRADRILYLASRFACKEAVFKAFGVAWEMDDRARDIEIIGAENEPPEAVVHGRFDSLLRERKGNLMVSLSYDADYAVAFALLEAPFL
jgi:phosphopantetheine--protein transferase-like protein